jgi:hypothetical protein
LNHHEHPPSLRDTCAIDPNKSPNKLQANINSKRRKPIKETTALINNTNKTKQHYKGVNKRHHKHQTKRQKFENIDRQEYELIWKDRQTRQTLKATAVATKATTDPMKAQNHQHNSNYKDDNTNEGDPRAQRYRYKHFSQNNGNIYQ